MKHIEIFQYLNEIITKLRYCKILTKFTQSHSSIRYISLSIAKKIDSINETKNARYL